MLRAMPRLSPRARASLALVICCTLAAGFGCERRREETHAVGTFPLVTVHRSFLSDEGRWTVRPSSGDAPEVRSISPGRDARLPGSGVRSALAAEHDFEWSLKVDAPPAGARLESAFAVPEEALEDRRGVTASLEVRIAGTTVIRREIDYDDPRSRTWSGVEVDLAPLDGRDGEVVLAAKVVAPDGARIVRGWSSPRIFVVEERDWRPATPETPNLVVVLVDTLRARSLGCYGYPRPTSPNLDRFAAGALLFENALAPAPWTWPSTATVFTGQYPLHHGVVDGTRNTLAFDKVTLAELCADAGMNTGAFIGNQIISPSRQFDQGFVTFERRRWGGAEAMVDRFGEWLETVRHGRFLAYLHFFDPHSPYEPPEEFLRRFSDPDSPERVPERTFAKLRGGINRRAMEVTPRRRAAVGNARDRYDAEILYWDHHFGRLLEMLRGAGLGDRTVVAVTSDHGEAFLEHGLIGHGLALYDPLVRVPMIVGGPRIEPGRVKEQVELVSFAPTVAAASNVDASAATFDGVSLLDPAHALTEDPKVRCDVFAARTARWKLHHEPRRDRVELYDLRADPEESTDVAAEHPQVVGRLRERLERWIRNYRALGELGRGWTETDLDEETREDLEQLGYIGEK